MRNDVPPDQPRDVWERLREHRLRTREGASSGRELRHATLNLLEDTELARRGEEEEAASRARAEIAAQASAARYRTLFASIDEAFCIIEVLFDASGRKCVDYRFLEVNPAFERHTGLAHAAGRTMRELVPNHDEFWFETYGRIALTGTPERFENRAAALGREYDVYAFRMGEPDAHTVALLFTDISERKRHEANLAFLAEISEDLVRLTRIEETMRALGGKICAHFRAAQCAFGEVDEGQQIVTVTHVWKREAATSFKGVHRLDEFYTEDFQRAGRAGEAYVVDDAAHDDRAHAGKMAAFAIGSLVNVPLVREGAWRFSLTLFDSAPRHWRADEIELMREFTARVWTRLERARAEEALARKTAIVEGINRIFNGALTSRTERELASLCLEVAEELTQSGCGFLGRINLETSQLEDVTVSARGRPQESDRTSGGFLLQGFWVRVQSEGQALLVNDPARAAEPIVVPAGLPPIRSLLAVPLKAGRRVVGMIGLGNRPGGYRPEDLEAMEGLAPAMIQALASKRGEAALRDSEERFRVALHAAGMAAWDYNVPANEVIWNEQHFRLLGLPVGDPRRKPEDFLRTVHAEDNARVREELRRAAEVTGIYRADFRIIRADTGEIRWMSGYGQAAESNHGPVRRMTGVMFDITEQQEAKARLAAAEERLRLVVDSALEHAIIALDLDRRVTNWNPGAEQILGYTRQEILGHPADIIFTPEDRAAGQPLREAAQAVTEGRANDNRWTQRKDGSRFWANGAMVPMRARPDGEIVGLVKILRDETQMREAQMALEESSERLLAALQENEKARAEVEAASAAKDRFLAMLSHELRTPLTPIMTATHVLERMPNLSEPVRQTIKMMRRNLKIEAQFIDDLLDVTRISSGKLEIVREPLDAHEVVQHAIEISQGDLSGKELQLHIALEATQHQLVGDFARLQQAFWNLLKNAAKFTPKGGEIRVYSWNEGGQLRVAVTDSGIGIEGEALTKIFDAFTQATPEISRQFGGLGLGLAIAKAGVEAHGGHIEVASGGLGAGATFTVQLPTSSSPA